MARIESYLARLYRYAFSLCRNEDTAKDLVQQCALRALSARKVPADEPAYRAWLFTILRNAMIDETRRRGTAEGHAAALAETPRDMEFWEADERFINVLSVRMGLARLGRNDREIIGLVDLAGLSYSEAAEILSVPQGTVMSRISRARQRLLVELKQSNVTPLASRQRHRTRSGS